MTQALALAAVTLVAFVTGGYLLTVVLLDMHDRVPPQFRGHVVLNGSVNELVWMQGVPVGMCRKYVLSQLLFCLAFVAAAAGLGFAVVSGWSEPRGLGFFILASGIAVLAIAFTLSTAIRHRDKLR